MRDLTEYTEEERAEAMSKYEKIRGCVQKERSQRKAAEEAGVAVKTIRRWIRAYEEGGLRGLVKEKRKDSGERRGMEPEEVKLVEGLALCKPEWSAATVHREMTKIAKQQGWKEPSYWTVYRIVKGIAGADKTMAVQGESVYREEYDLVLRRRAERPNEIWQADHMLLDIWVLDEQGKERRPWLTVILDDYSRAVAGYRVSFSAPSAQQTALVLREAVWRKQDGRWHVCGVPGRFYSDHGSDFTSKHMEQVGVDLKMELVYSQVGVPRGRGKIERFFGTVNQLLLERLPGFIPIEKRGKRGEKKGELTLGEFERIFGDWLLDEYHRREHSEVKKAPQQAWEEGGFVPRLPERLEELDLLLLAVEGSRKVQQDGISFRGQRYQAPTLAGYVKEEVSLRYDPRDMAEVRVYHQGVFVCRAICEELSGEVISLKELVKARKESHRLVKERLSEREEIVERYLEVHRVKREEKVEEKIGEEKPRLKRFKND